ncbi:MAG TPA: ABC transporter permease [Blastocatellia bacterium]|jgi:putative ABC transport system permease protein
MEALLQDLRLAARTLKRKPGFTIIAALTLALGIGANTALFSVINGVLLESLQFKEPDRLLFVWETNPRFPSPTLAVSTLNYRDWKEQNTVFAGLAARQFFAANLSGQEQPEKVQGEKVTADYFRVLGIEPLAGRHFTDEEDRPGREPVVLLSHGLWQRRFGGDPGIINRTVLLNGQSATVVGIMPNDYRPNIEFWAPLAIDYTNADRSLHNLQVIGRLAPGISQQLAQEEMSMIASRLAEQYPDLNAGWGVALVPVHDQIVQNVRQALWILFAAVGVVLLIACVNVANLLLARAASREREIAIRIALGASRWRIMRQMLTESFLLSIIGGAAGVLLALWGTDLLLSLNPQGIPRAQEIGMDLQVLGFALAVSTISGLLFGLAPALQASRPDLNENLKESGKSSSASARGRYIRNTLVVAEVALALVLLVCAGLLIKSFSVLQTVAVGFNRENLLTFQLSLPPAQYQTGDNVFALQREASERLGQLPGVSSVAAISHAPLAGGGPQFIFAVEGRPIPTPSEAPLSSFRLITPGYFATMGIPLIKGRLLDDSDDLKSKQVIIINQIMAERMWPGQDPVGKKLTVGVPLPGDEPDWVEVVGVVGNVKHTTLTGETGMQMYQSVYQAAGFLQAMSRNMTFILRTSLAPMSVLDSARSIVASLDPTLPVATPKTMEAIISDSVAPFRFNMFLLGLFAAVALFLTLIGVYGVMNYSVAQRTQEIGIRMALGASPGQVRSLVMRQGLALSAAGLGLGLAGAVGATRLLSSLLYGVSVTDPIVFIIVGLLLAGVAALACYIPSRKATRVDPIIALRYE